MAPGKKPKGKRGKRGNGALCTDAPCRDANASREHCVQQVPDQHILAATSCVGSSRRLKAAFSWWKRFASARHNLRNDVRLAGLLADKQKVRPLCKQALAYGIIVKTQKSARHHLGATLSSVFDDIREHAELAISLRQYFTVWYSAANGSSQKPPLFIKTDKWKGR